MNIIIMAAVRVMRNFLVFSCFVLISFFCPAQDFTDRGYWSELMRYNNLSIDSLWLFHSGSDMPSTDINGAGGEIANTELLQDKNGEHLSNQGVGWYQKKFDVPVAFRNRPVAIRMGHFGASEIYLDGKLIQRYGIVGSSMENEEIFIPREPFMIYLDSQTSHNVLVHYSNLHASRTGYANHHIGFRLLVARPDIFPQTELGIIPTLPVSVGIMILFSIFFLFVYFFYPKRLASLVVVLLLLNFCVLLTSVYFSLRENEWYPMVRASNIIGVTAFWTHLFTLLVLYALYYAGKMPRRTWIVVAGMILWIFAVLNPRFLFFSGPLIILVYVEIYRMLILGIRNKKSGFWILLIGVLIQQAGFFLIVLDIFHWFPVLTPEVLLLQMIIPQLGFPLTYSLHLAWEFGSANRDLQLQLVRVNELSKKSLKQEQEKQQLLTSQNETLEKQVLERTNDLNLSLRNLQDTQSKLIQSEKMASLGELTASIAHEIQNPLNFVNNFSEVNKELAEELKGELATGNQPSDSFLKAMGIADDIIDNSEKINHHGKRADAIVKSMLQHSRSTSGQKEATDINALCEKFLRLSYHGFHVKDNSFDATIKTDFDESISSINIIPQEIGRVLLNVYNNAFYAVSTKAKELAMGDISTLATADSMNVKKNETGDGYEPVISVSTRKYSDKIELHVVDNGVGIPEKLVDKIFQPFFTTKPTGSGTGLGLSLSYDIIKAHGGEIKVKTTVGEGAEFIIILPVN